MDTYNRFYYKIIPIVVKILTLHGHFKINNLRIFCEKKIFTSHPASSVTAPSEGSRRGLATPWVLGDSVPRAPAECSGGGMNGLSWASETLPPARDPELQSTEGPSQVALRPAPPDAR